MYEKIDFGTIGIKIGDIITFTLNGEKAKVVSGDGTPGNGGNLLNGNVAGYDGLVSITVATKKLAGSDYTEGMDVFSFWSCKGKTLRELHEENKQQFINTKGEL